MNKFLILLFMAGFCFGQKKNVAELQLKLKPGNTEELLYGFAAGDKILLTVEEANGNTIDEVSVAQYPDTYKYKGTDVKKEKNREFYVTEKSVYKFKFSNAGREIRICNVKIQRDPASKATENFNTAIKWVTVQDTVYKLVTKEVVVGYDTLSVQNTRRAIVFEKKYEEIVLDKNQRVESLATLGQSRAGVAFSLPVNYASKDETRKVVAWAYWVGVGEDSNEYWKQNRKMIVGAVQGVASYFSTPLGGIAAGAVTNLALPSNGEDVEYALVNEPNAKLFFQEKQYKAMDNGKGIAAYKRFTDANMMQGKYSVLLINDNYVQPIDVNVKVSAIIEHIKYKEGKVIDKVINPRYEKKIFREPEIITAKIPVSQDSKK